MQQMVNITYLLNQRLNWYHKEVDAKTTHLLISIIFCFCEMSMLWGRDRGLRLNPRGLAFAWGFLSKLLVATTAEIDDCLFWQGIGKLIELDKEPRLYENSATYTLLLEINSNSVESSPELVLDSEPESD